MCLRLQKIIKTRRTYSHSNTCTCNLGLSRLEHFLFLLLFVLRYFAFQCFDSMSCALTQSSTCIFFYQKITLVFQDCSQHCIPRFMFRKHMLYMQLSTFHSQKYFFYCINHLIKISQWVRYINVIKQIAALKQKLILGVIRFTKMITISIRGRIFNVSTENNETYI